MLGRLLPIVAACRTSLTQHQFLVAISNHKASISSVILTTEQSASTYLIASSDKLSIANPSIPRCCPSVNSAKRVHRECSSRRSQLCDDGDSVVDTTTDVLTRCRAARRHILGRASRVDRHKIANDGIGYWRQAPSEQRQLSRWDARRWLGAAKPGGTYYGRHLCES